MNTHNHNPMARQRPNLRIILPQTTATAPLFSRRELRRLVAEMID